MRRQFFLVVLVSLAWVGQAQAAAGLTEAVTQGSMRAQTDEGVVELPLKHTGVKGEISDVVSRVKVRQTFANPYETPIEAVYVFPLPEDAAVGDMTITVGERVVRSVIKRRAEARQIYEKARDEGRTAALLEQERPNIFTQSVANIMPGREIVVEITYDVVLKLDGGVYEFVFPMVVGPRFMPGAPISDPQSGGGWAKDTDAVKDASRISPHVLPEGLRSGHDISLDLVIRPPAPIEGLASPTHEIVAAPSARGQTGPYTVSISPGDTIPNKDFVLRFGLEAPEATDIVCLSHRGEQSGYTLLSFMPPEVPKREEITARELFFVVDTSGSMKGRPLDTVKRAMLYALHNMNPGDTFQVMEFSNGVNTLASGPLEQTMHNLRRAEDFVKGLDAGGGTQMMKGVLEALDSPRTGRLRLIVFMTDGYVGNENQIHKAISQRIDAETRLFSFGVGSSVNRFLLERMAEIGRGSAAFMLPHEDPQDQVKAFYSRIARPVLTDIQIDFEGIEIKDISPKRAPDLFAGQPLRFIGRFKDGGQGSVKVRGRMAGAPVTYTLPVSLPKTAKADNGALAQLWARRRIHELELDRLIDSDLDHEAIITDLALEYRLASQYTSFVAVEETVVNEDGELKTIQVPVLMPEGVEEEGVFGERRIVRAAQNLPGSMGYGGGGAISLDVDAYEMGEGVSPFSLRLESGLALSSEPAFAAFIAAGFSPSWFLTTALEVGLVGPLGEGDLLSTALLRTTFKPLVGRNIWLWGIHADFGVGAAFFLPEAASEDAATGIGLHGGLGYDLKLTRSLWLGVQLRYDAALLSERDTIHTFTQGLSVHWQ